MSVEIGTLETYLRKKRSEGRKLVVPYITGGFKGWTDAIRAAAANGAVWLHHNRQRLAQVQHLWRARQRSSGARGEPGSRQPLA